MSSSNGTYSCIHSIIKKIRSGFKSFYNGLSREHGRTLAVHVGAGEADVVKKLLGKRVHNNVGKFFALIKSHRDNFSCLCDRFQDSHEKYKFHFCFECFFFDGCKCYSVNLLVSRSFHGVLWYLQVQVVILRLVFELSNLFRLMKMRLFCLGFFVRLRQVTNDISIR